MTPLYKPSSNETSKNQENKQCKVDFFAFHLWYFFSDKKLVKSLDGIRFASFEDPKPFFLAQKGIFGIGGEELYVIRRGFSISSQLFETFFEFC